MSKMFIQPDIPADRVLGSGMNESQFNVVQGAMPKRTKKPAASFNLSDSGPLMGGSDPVMKTSISAPSQPVAQTSSPKENLHPTQFGKHRKPDTSAMGASSAPVGKHSSGGKHRAPLGGKQDIQAHMRAKETGYQGSHAKGRHARDYNPQTDITRSSGPSKTYVGKHSAKGQLNLPESPIGRASKGRTSHMNLHQFGSHVSGQARSIAQILGMMHRKV